VATPAIKVTGAIMSDSDSMGGSASDVSGGTASTNARRASGRRRRIQVIGALAVVAVAAAVIVGITTSGSRSGTLATDYAGATLTCAEGGKTALTLPKAPTNLAIHVRWDGDPDGWVTEINRDYEMSTSTKTWSVATETQFGFGLMSVTVSQTVGTDTWSISAPCTLL